MKKAIVIVDMQNDFVTGALANPAAAAVIPGIKKLLEENAASAESAAVFFTMDTHGDNYLQTQEGQKLPVPHCIRGTAGWAICPELAPFAKAARVIEKPVFGSVELGAALKEFDEVLFAGVCTDICVISNAMVARAFSPELRIRIARDLCAGTTVQNHENALQALACCQAEIV